MFRKQNQRKLNFRAFVILILLHVIKLCECDHQHLGNACRGHFDCDTALCHPSRKVCECFELPSYNEVKKMDQLYDQGKCFSRLHQMCTLPIADLDGLPPHVCVNGAYCEFSPVGPASRKIFGYCTCKPGLIPSENGKLCKLNPKQNEFEQTFFSRGTQHNLKYYNCSSLVCSNDNLAVYFTLFLYMLN